MFSDIKYIRDYTGTITIHLLNAFIQQTEIDVALTVILLNYFSSASCKALCLYGFDYSMPHISGILQYLSFVAGLRLAYQVQGQFMLYILRFLFKAQQYLIIDNFLFSL